MRLLNMRGNEMFHEQAFIASQRTTILTENEANVCSSLLENLGKTPNVSWIW